MRYYVAEISIITGDSQNLADLIRERCDRPKMGDDPGDLDFRAVVVSISGRFIDAGWGKETLLVVKPKGS